MTIFLAVLAGLAAFIASAFIIAYCKVLLADRIQLFALLFRVQPYKTVFTMIGVFAAAWTGLSAFDAIV
jgi:hypothetical protein